MTRAQDYLLYALIGMVEKLGPTSDLHLPLTVNVRGVLIAGNLVREATYLRLQGDQLAQGFEQMDASLLSVGHSLRQLYGKGAEDLGKTREVEAPGEFDFLHVADVKTIGGSPVTGAPSHWRIRTDEVSGFSLGTATMVPQRA